MPLPCCALCYEKYLTIDDVDMEKYGSEGSLPLEKRRDWYFKEHLKKDGEDLTFHQDQFDEALARYQEKYGDRYWVMHKGKNGVCDCDCHVHGLNLRH